MRSEIDLPVPDSWPPSEWISKSVDAVDDKVCLGNVRGSMWDEVAKLGELVNEQLNEGRRGKVVKSGGRGEWDMLVADAGYKGITWGRLRSERCRYHKMDMVDVMLRRLSTQMWGASRLALSCGMILPIPQNRMTSPN